MKDSTKLLQFSIAIIAAILFIPFLGQAHLFDWDEINFAEAAREMIASKHYLTVQINFQPFWEKPPLFIWMQVLSMKVFGINEFAARFPNAICGIASLLVLFNLGRKLLNNNFGLLWTMVYGCSLLPFFYFKSGIIDPWFNLFIFLGINYAFNFTLSTVEKERIRFVALAALFIGLAILTKGPVGLLIFGLTYGVYLIIKMFKVKIKLLHVLVFTGILAAVGGFWFILLIVTGHTDILKEFFIYQVRLFQTKDAGHGGFLLYHFVVLFLGVFPASIFALRSFVHDRKDDREKLHEYKNWMMILFWTVLILFTIVKTKIVHYSSMCYFPLTFLGAYVIFKLQEQNRSMPRWMKAVILSVAIFWGLIVIGLQLIVENKEKIIGLDIIKDEFAVGNLQANVPWTGYEFLIGLLFVVAITLIFASHRLNLKNQVMAVLISTLLFTYATVYVITPRIEGYSQRAAIEFYQNRQNEDCYVETLGFKSYAHLFYVQKPASSNPKSADSQWLLEGEIDKPAYFVMKNTSKKEQLERHPQLKVLYEKNGFVFVKRDISDK
ncbi:MAG: glycosyltransferase family 39 protein [Bacteroidota bacterium]|nr:glycosyltransferase family 39 protein [Bacteroidota bacterium]